MRNFYFFFSMAGRSVLQYFSAITGIRVGYLAIISRDSASLSSADKR